MRPRETGVLTFFVICAAAFLFYSLVAYRGIRSERRLPSRNLEDPRHRRVRIQTHVRTTGYLSANSELVWLSEKRAGKICATSELDDVAWGSRLAVSYAKRAFDPRGQPAPSASPDENKALSHFYRHNGTSPHGEGNHALDPIEPLSGIARHPFAQVGCAWHRNNAHDINIFDITNLIIFNNCGSKLPKPRTFLFDMGASVGFNGIPGGLYETIPMHGGGLSPSLPLFYRIYQDRCLEPDDIFAWEPNPRVNGSEWFGELPASIRAKVRFFNDFVSEGALSDAEAPMGTGKHPANSFIEILEAVAKPEDFVVVKVDIDTPEVELMIVEAIVKKPHLAGLIDELFFEDHFSFDGMNFGWGGKVAGDVDSALGRMRRLRELGVRAHFWI